MSVTRDNLSADKIYVITNKRSADDHKVNHGYELGTQVKLIDDDGTGAPDFIALDGEFKGVRQYVELEDIREV